MSDTKPQPRIGSLRWRRQTVEDEDPAQQARDAEEELLTRRDEGSETDDC